MNSDKKPKKPRSDSGRSRQKAGDPRTHAGVRFSGAIRLRALRERRGLKQAVAAEQMGVPPSTLIRNELGIGERLSRSVLAAASTFYGVTPEWLEHGLGEGPAGLPAVATQSGPSAPRFEVPADGLLRLKNVASPRETIPFAAGLLAHTGVTNFQHLCIHLDPSGQVHVLDGVDLSPGIFVLHDSETEQLRTCELVRHQTSFGDGLFAVGHDHNGRYLLAVRPSDIRGRVVLTLAPPPPPPKPSSEPSA